MMADNSGLIYTAVRDMKPSSKCINFLVMVLEPVGYSHRTKDNGEVKTFKVADKTGSINLCVFGDNGQYLKPGDIIRVKSGYSSLFRNCLTAYVGKAGELKRVGEFCFLVSEEPNMSESSIFPQQLAGHSFPAGGGLQNQHLAAGPALSTSFGNQPPFTEHSQLARGANAGVH